MKVVKILDKQTTIDIAVQELGDAERAMEVAELNGIPVTQNLIAGQTLLVPDFDISKRNIVQLFKDTSNAPASADDENILSILEGIGYWYLENDFVVQ